MHPVFSEIKVYNSTFLVADIRTVALAPSELRFQRAARSALVGSESSHILFLLTSKVADAAMRVFDVTGKENTDPTFAFLAAFAYLGKFSDEKAPTVECDHRVYHAKISDIRPNAISVEGEVKAVMPLLDRFQEFHPCFLEGSAYPVFPVLAESLHITVFGDFTNREELQEKIADNIVQEWKARSGFPIVFAEILSRNNLKIKCLFSKNTSEMSIENCLAAAAYSTVMSSLFDLDDYIRILCGKDRYCARVSISQTEERTVWLYTSISILEVPGKESEIACLFKREKDK